MPFDPGQQVERTRSSTGIARGGITLGVSEMTVYYYESYFWRETPCVNKVLRYRQSYSLVYCMQTWISDHHGNFALMLSSSLDRWRPDGTADQDSDTFATHFLAVQEISHD